MQLYSFVFTGKDPRKGWRTPMNIIKYSEQRDEETGNNELRRIGHEILCYREYVKKNVYLCSVKSIGIRRDSL